MSLTWLIPIAFIALFIWVIVWAIRSSRAHEQEKHEKLARAGFAREVRPGQHAAMQVKWESLEEQMLHRTRQGYTLWYLEKPDSEGPATPFLAIEFDHPVDRPTQAWILPAFAQEGGMVQKMFGFMAKMSGNKHRLPVPSNLRSKWWAWGGSAAWLPSAPPAEFWDVLSRAPAMSLHFQKHGIKIEAHSDPQTRRPPDRLALLDPRFLSWVEDLAAAFAHRPH